MSTPGIKDELVKEIRRMAAEDQDDPSAKMSREQIVDSIVNRVRKSHMHIPVTKKMTEKIVNSVLDGTDDDHEDKQETNDTQVNEQEAMESQAAQDTVSASSNPFMKLRI
jgi:GTPase SAR1 family protein